MFENVTVNWQSSICIETHDAVLYLESSEKFFTKENNEARYEDAQGAIEVDNTTLKGWSGHPNRVIVKQEVDIHSKLDNTVNAILDFITFR